MIAQNPKQQETWATGDFSMIGTGVTLVGELLCDSIPVHAGERLLDIATGSGNDAITVTSGWVSTGMPWAFSHAAEMLPLVALASAACAVA